MNSTSRPGPLAGRVALGAAAAISLTAIAGCAGAADEPDAPRSLSVAVDAFSVLIDPGQIMNQPLYEPLISWDIDAQDFTPWLAEDFEIADDRRSIVFTIRDGVEFTDGTRLDAQVIADYLTVARAKQLPAVAFLELWGTEVEAVDDETLVFRTERGIVAQFLFTLQGMAIANPAALEEGVDLTRESAGTGPYILAELVPEVSATYTRNPDYWNPDAYDFDELTYLVLPDEVAAYNAFSTGQVDAFQASTTMALTAEEAGHEIHRSIGAFSTLVILDYDGRMVPALGDVRVRQAMNLAIDRASLLESLEHGSGSDRTQPFSPAQRAYVEGGDDRYEYDLERAKALMAEAGYEDGFTIQIPSMAGSVVYPSAYDPALQQMLGEIGITVEFTSFADLGALLGAWGEFPVISAVPAYITTIWGINSLDGPGFFQGHFTDDPSSGRSSSPISTGASRRAWRRKKRWASTSSTRRGSCP